MGRKKGKKISDNLRKDLMQKARHAVRGCQMVYFRTENLNLGKFWRVLRLEMSVCFTAIWYLMAVL
jgi:hypothetical protein